MSHSRTFETSCSRMYFFSAGLCMIALATSAWIVIVTISINLVSLLLIGSQAGVYAVIALYARLCRKDAVASVIVALMALITVGLGAAMLYFLLAFVSAPSAGPAVLFLVVPIFGQMIVGVLGCYIGYAIIECQARDKHQYNSTRGKLLVVFMITMAMFFTSWLWFFTV